MCGIIVEYNALNKEQTIMSDDSLKDDDPRLTPLDREALRAVRGRARNAQKIRIAHYTDRVASILKECAAFRETVRPDEEELLRAVEEDEKMCHAFLELICQNATADEELAGSELSRRFIEVGIQALIDHFGHTVLPDFG